MMRSFLPCPRRTLRSSSHRRHRTHRTLRSIIVPIISPGIAVCALICFIFAWNELLLWQHLHQRHRRNRASIPPASSPHKAYSGQSLHGRHRRIPAVIIAGFATRQASSKASPSAQSNKAILVPR